MSLDIQARAELRKLLRKLGEGGGPEEEEEKSPPVIDDLFAQMILLFTKVDKPRLSRRSNADQISFEAYFWSLKNHVERAVLIFYYQLDIVRLNVGSPAIVTRAVPDDIRMRRGIDILTEFVIETYAALLKAHTLKSPRKLPGKVTYIMGPLNGAYVNPDIVPHYTVRIILGLIGRLYRGKIHGGMYGSLVCSRVNYDYAMHFMDMLLASTRAATDMFLGKSSVASKFDFAAFIKQTAAATEIFKNPAKPLPPGVTMDVPMVLSPPLADPPTSKGRPKHPKRPRPDEEVTHLNPRPAGQKALDNIKEGASKEKGGTAQVTQQSSLSASSSSSSDGDKKGRGRPRGTTTQRPVQQMVMALKSKSEFDRAETMHNALYTSLEGVFGEYKEFARLFDVSSAIADAAFKIVPDGETVDPPHKDIQDADNFRFGTFDMPLIVLWNNFAFGSTGNVNLLYKNQPLLIYWNKFRLRELQELMLETVDQWLVHVVDREDAEEVELAAVYKAYTDVISALDSSLALLERRQIQQGIVQSGVAGVLLSATGIAAQMQEVITGMGSRFRGMFNGKHQMLQYLYSQISTDNRVETANHIIVGGEPGTGKTSILQFIVPMMVRSGLILPMEPVLAFQLANSVWGIMDREDRQSLTDKFEQTKMFSDGKDMYSTGQAPELNDNVQKLMALLLDLDALRPDRTPPTKLPTEMLGLYEGHSNFHVQRAILQTLGSMFILDEAYLVAKMSSSDQGAFLGQINAQITVQKLHWGSALLGYKQEVINALKLANPGLLSRYQTQMDFGSYLPRELTTIFLSRMISSGVLPDLLGSSHSADVTSADAILLVPNDQIKLHMALFAQRVHHLIREFGSRQVVPNDNRILRNVFGSGNGRSAEGLTQTVLKFLPKSKNVFERLMGDGTPLRLIGVDRISEALFELDSAGAKLSDFKELPVLSSTGQFVRLESQQEARERHVFKSNIPQSYVLAAVSRIIPSARADINNVLGELIHKYGALQVSDQDQQIINNNDLKRGLKERVVAETIKTLFAGIPSEIAKGMETLLGRELETAYYKVARATISNSNEIENAVRSIVYHQISRDSPSETSEQLSDVHPVVLVKEVSLDLVLQQHPQTTPPMPPQTTPSLPPQTTPSLPPQKTLPGVPMEDG